MSLHAVTCRYTPLRAVPLHAGMHRYMPLHVATCRYTPFLSTQECTDIAARMLDLDIYLRALLAFSVEHAAVSLLLCSFLDAIDPTTFLQQTKGAFALTEEQRQERQRQEETDAAHAAAVARELSPTRTPEAQYPPSQLSVITRSHVALTAPFRIATARPWSLGRCRVRGADGGLRDGRIPFRPSPDRRGDLLRYNEMYRDTPRYAEMHRNLLRLVWSEIIGEIGSRSSMQWAAPG